MRFKDLKNVLARIRTWSSTFAESRAIHHTPRTLRTCRASTPPRIRTSSGSFEHCRASTTLAGQFVELALKKTKHPTAHPVGSPGLLALSCLDLDSNQDQDLRRVRCDPLHHRDAAPKSFKRTQSRRLDSHQHHPVYKTGAFLFRATSALNDSIKHEREDLNPVGRLWRPPALPGARSCRTHGRSSVSR